MFSDLLRAQRAHDLEQAPGCFDPEPAPSQSDLYASFWSAIVDAAGGTSVHAICERLGGPALTHDWSSLDLGLQFDRGSPEYMVIALRAAANAGEMWLKEHGKVLE